jgi:hypothetical protein
MGSEAGPRADDAGPRRFGPARREVAAALELFAAAGLAITQPALDLLGRNVGLLVTQRATTLEIVLLVVGITLGPTLAAWLVELGAGLIFPPARRWAHAALIAMFVGLFVERALKGETDLGAPALVVAALLGAAAAAALVIRSAVARQFLRYLAVAPIAFVVVFLGFSPAAAIVAGDEPGSVSGTTIAHPKRVVMIVADELPLGSLLDGAGAVDAQLFPHFAALAGTSTWYRNDTTVSPFTTWAVPALDTGQNPSHPDAPPIASVYPDSIFRLLGGVYRMNVSESGTSLCPTTLCSSATATGTVGTVRRLAVATRDLWWDVASPDRPARPTLDAPQDYEPPLVQVNRFVRALRPTTTPTFDYLHVLLPHQPWHYFPTLQDSGFDQYDPFKLANNLAWESDEAAAVGRARHILQLQALDALLGRVMDRLHAIGAWDDSVVVVTADHGEAFTGGRPLRSATRATASEVLWTPLFFKLPGQTAGVVDDRPVQSIDVVPTIAAVLGADPPWKLDGTSMLGPPRAEFPRPLYQWSFGNLNAPGAPLAADGGHLTFPAAPNFAKVLRSRAAPAGGDAALRPYRVAPYGALVGQPAAPLVGPPVSRAAVFVPDTARFDAVDPTAGSVPWTWLTGNVLGVPSDRALAFTVNGRVAAVVGITPRPQQQGFYGAVLPPQLFAPGANDVEAYAVSGPPSRPVLQQVEIARAG